MRTNVCCFLLIVLGIGCFSACTPATEESHWTSAEQPLAEIKQLRALIKAPSFPEKDFLVTDFGASGDGKTLNTGAFKKAIEACAQQGGGRVVVPAGTFLTGAIYLKSHVNLHVSEGATVLFSRDSSDYPIVFSRWEGSECMNYSAFIYAYEEEDIAITGKGTLDGNADNEHWWWWCGAKKFGWNETLGKQTPARNALQEMTHQQVDPKKRVFGDGHFLRPNFVQPYRCKNVWIADVKLINSPMWNLNPVLCENVLVEGVKVISHGPNTDGCDPEACKNVWIKDCYFDTGDDCIAIKSGRDEDGRNIGRPAENHLVEGCIMKDGHGGVVIGSEISGGAKNIYALNCQMDSPNLDRVLRIKTSSSRGGIIENVFMKDVQVGAFKEAAVLCTMFYEKPGDFMPTIRNIWVENLKVEKGGKHALVVNAYQESPVTDLRMVNCDLQGIQEPFQVDYVKDLVFEQVKINGQEMEAPKSKE